MLFRIFFQTVSIMVIKCASRSIHGLFYFGNVQNNDAEQCDVIKICNFGTRVQSIIAPKHYATINQDQSVPVKSASLKSMLLFSWPARALVAFIVVVGARRGLCRSVDGLNIL